LWPAQPDEALAEGDSAAAGAARLNSLFVRDGLGPKDVTVGEGLMVGLGPCIFGFLFFGVCAHEIIITTLVFTI